MDRGSAGIVDMTPPQANNALVTSMAEVGRGLRRSSPSQDEALGDGKTWTLLNLRLVPIYSQSGTSSYICGEPSGL